MLFRSIETMSEDDHNESKHAKEENKEETQDELDVLKKKVKEMEDEDAKLRAMQAELETSSTDASGASKEEIDQRSVYVGNVDYTTTPEDLQQHFHSCGTINRVTILCDKFTGHPKGFAYVEFADKDSATNALLMNETSFKGRQLKVSSKRTNVPGMKMHSPRGGGGYAPPMVPRGYGYRPFFPPRGGRFRGGRRGYFSPYG